MSIDKISSVKSTSLLNCTMRRQTFATIKYQSLCILYLNDASVQLPVAHAASGEMIRIWRKSCLLQCLGAIMTNELHNIKEDI